jgi:hypothetical protein
MAVSVTFTGVEQVLANMDAFARLCLRAIQLIAEYLSAAFENYAKEFAPWTDRTANARQALHGFWEDRANDAVEVYISHGMSYGIFLELRWAGKYAILVDTIQAHLPEIDRILKAVFS